MRKHTGRGFGAIALVVAIAGLAGCQDQPTGTTPANSGFYSQGSSSLSISELSFDSEHITSGERFQATFKIPEAGSQNLTKYGVKTEVGEKLFDIKPALPVVNGGKVTMWVGPLTGLTKGGQLALEFWVVDDQGRASNHLPESLVIQ